MSSALPPPATAPKKIVYLWGAGATQAEALFLGARPVNLLMRDSEQLGEGVATRILKELPKKWRPSFSADKGTDIEKLISLLTASSLVAYEKVAENIRKLYFEDICRSLAAAQILTNPSLAIALLSLHHDTQFSTHEQLSGIITTNHDGLLQVASQKVFGAVNLGIAFQAGDGKTLPSDVPPALLHLHGSFTWTFGLPVRVCVLDDNSAYSPETVWIPPTILKESKNYPFNKLAGHAYELLSRRCDVLRVVGSSLTQNDWNIISMIFNAQRHCESRKLAAFKIELIMSPTSGATIAGDCSYLRNLTPISYLSDGDFAAYKEDPSTYTPEMRNALFYWLKQKLTYHRQRGDLNTPTDPVLAIVSGDAS